MLITYVNNFINQELNEIIQKQLSSTSSLEYNSRV